MSHVTLEELLSILDAAEANLNKLDVLWEQASPLIPTAPAAGTTSEYEMCRRRWRTLAAALPRIDGWTIVPDLPDIDVHGRSFIQYSEAGLPPFSLLNEGEQAGHDLDEYRYRLEAARRRAIRRRIDELVQQIDSLLSTIVQDIPRDSRSVLDGQECIAVKDRVAEIERLIGSGLTRRGRWSDLWRHLGFGQGHDWHDIVEFDWPDVRSQLLRLTTSEWEPVPTPAVDIGEASRAQPTGGVAVGLNWRELTDEDFERVLFNLVDRFDNYQNVAWLMKTNAPDRGRDVSAERVLQDGSGETRTERVVIQAKHWLSRSIRPQDVSDCLAAIKLWEPPPVHAIVLATSGHFTSDAVKWIEDHNAANRQPRLEMWPQSRMEAMLAQEPGVIAQFGLASPLSTPGLDP